jgi:hypothetical protein
VFSPFGEGFSLPYKISYRAVKLPRVSAALGRFYLRRGADLPQVAIELKCRPTYRSAILRGVRLDLMLACLHQTMILIRAEAAAPNVTGGPVRRST